MTRLARVSWAPLALCAVTACEPCHPTLDCTRSPTVVIVGRIIEEGLGEGVPGVRIEATRDSGVSLLDAGATLTTSADGSFEIRLRAAAAGPAHLTLRVAHDNEPSYVVPLRAQATVAQGDATVLPPWIDSRPRFQYVVVLSGSDGVTPLPNTLLEFRRTSGTQLFVDSGAVAFVRGTTGENGWSFLLENVWTDRVGSVFGDLRIIRAPGDTVVLQQVAFAATPFFRERHQYLTIAVTP